ncbi:MAG TPA: NAD(P)-binding domain-containing protein [Cyclobacteriaceae bacterium]
MSTNKSKVAIIGVGNIGKAVATNLVKGTRPVILASRKFEDAKALAQQLGNLATPMEISAAIKEAEIIIFAVWFSSIKELLHQHASALQGKIIVDPSNPIAPDGKGGFVKVIGEKESAGEILLALLPNVAKFVKAFGTLGAASLSSAANRKTERAVLFYATNDASLNKIVDELIHDSGFDSLRIGNIDQSIRLEVFGELHEFGALGKTVTLSEMKEKV